MSDCAAVAMQSGDLAAAEACGASELHRHCDEYALCPMRRVFANWKEWGIPELERGLLRADLLRIKPLENRPALTAMRGHVHSGKRLVVLSGKTRAGKTVAATWALSRLGGRYVRACDLTRMDFDMAPPIKANALVIDQLGFEPIGKTDWALGQFLDVIDARYAASRLTILCANMTLQTIETRYRKAFMGRLREGGVFVPVESAP